MLCLARVDSLTAGYSLHSALHEQVTLSITRVARDRPLQR